MKFDRLFITFITTAVLVSTAVSCKDDDDDSESLDGYLEFVAPDYAAPGTVLTMTPKGASHPEGGDMGYYWLATNIITKADTTRHIGDPSSVLGTETITLPDSLYTVTVTCVAFAKGYSNMYAYKYVTIVSDKSITNVPAVKGEGTFTDARDGKKYTYVTANGLDWMNGNLRYAGAGKPMSGCEPMTDLFGNLYTYEQAENSCPAGWRLPSCDEWKALCGGSLDGASGSLMVDAKFNGEKMWEYWPKVDISNKTGMNVIPVGYATAKGEDWDYLGVNEYALLWTSTDYDDEQKIFIELYVDQPDVLIGNSHTNSVAASVRCVRDSE